MNGHYEVSFIQMLRFTTDTVLVMPEGYEPFAVMGNHVLCRKWVNGEKTETQEEPRA